MPGLTGQIAVTPVNEQRLGVVLRILMACALVVAVLIGANRVIEFNDRRYMERLVEWHEQGHDIDKAVPCLVKRFFNLNLNRLRFVFEI